MLPIERCAYHFHQDPLGGPRCTALGTVRLLGPDQDPVPGGIYCEDHARELCAEYREKAQESWSYVPLMAEDVPLEGDFAGGLDAEFLRRFWGHEVTPAGVAKGYLGAIRSRMLAELAVTDSNAEIERTLRPCVCGHLLVPVARYLRDHGYALLGFQVGYPFEVTLPLMADGHPRNLPGPVTYRTYHVREERWGKHREQVRLHAVFTRKDGSHGVVKNPYTLALLREALGLVEA